MIKRLSVIVSLLMVIGFALPAAAQLPDPDAVPAPGTREIFRVLAYGDSVFESSWYVDASQNNVDRTTAAWYNGPLGALVFFSLLHFPDSVTVTELPDYFDDAYFETVLSNYVPYSLKSMCSAEGVTLMIFDAINNDEAYTLHYYYQLAPAVDRSLDGPSDRVLAVQFSFPVTQTRDLLRYSAALFPELPTC